MDCPQLVAFYKEKAAVAFSEWLSIGMKAIELAFRKHRN